MFRHLKQISVLILLFLSFNISAAEIIRDKDLVSAITGGDSKELQEAIDYIKLNHPSTLPLLLKEEFLDDDDEDARVGIITALKEYPVPEQTALWIEFLRTAKDKKTEIALIEFLSGSKTASFTIPIAEKLLVPRSEVREKAAMVLKKYGDDRMFPVILSLGQSKNTIDRIYFLEALNHLYDVRFQKLAISMLDDENKSVRIYAIKCVNNNEVKEALPSLRRLTAKDDNNETRKMGIESLVSFKDTQSGSMLIGILKDQSGEMRIEAVKALKELKYYSAAAPISEMLTREENTEIKYAALDTLISFKKAGNTKGLAHIIKKDPDSKMRIKAVYTLGVVGEESSTLEVLKEAALDEDYRVRGEACNAMGSLKKGSASEILLNQIKTDKSRYVRSAALYSIVKINDSKNIIKLFDIYSNEEDRVFKEILRGIIRNSLNKHIK
jgi:HEAT repeat protein